jgi:hypothetical protein
MLLSSLLESYRVHAKAQAAGFRAIGKDVPEMRIAGVANSFDAGCAVAGIEVIRDGIHGDRLSEGRPAGARVKFFRGVEQNGIAAQAGIDSGLEEAAHGRAEGALGACLASDHILFSAELPAPFGIGLYDLMIGRGIAIFGKEENVIPLEHLLIMARQMG